MQYKPAYMVVNNGQLEAFVGNYDSLEDVRADYPKHMFVCWIEKDRFLIRVLSLEELKAPPFFIFTNTKKGGVQDDQKDHLSAARSSSVMVLY